MKKTVWAVIQDGKKYLVGKRSRKVNNSGQYGFFGGTVDPHETEEAALRRELFEESGLKVKSCKYLFTCVKDGKSMAFFAVSTKNHKVSLNNETSRAKWWSQKDIEAKPMHLPVKSFFKRKNLQKNLQFRLQMSHGGLKQNVVAFCDGVVVGSAAVVIPSQTLVGLNVVPQFRGEGVASSIMQYIMSSPNPPTRLTAEASLGSSLKGADLQRFYSKWGFSMKQGDENMARMGL